MFEKHAQLGAQYLQRWRKSASICEAQLVLLQIGSVVVFASKMNFRFNGILTGLELKSLTLVYSNLQVCGDCPCSNIPITLGLEALTKPCFCQSRHHAIGHFRRKNSKFLYPCRAIVLFVCFIRHKTCVSSCLVYADFYHSRLGAQTTVCSRLLGLMNLWAQKCSLGAINLKNICISFLSPKLVSWISERC